MRVYDSGILEPEELGKNGKDLAEHFYDAYRPLKESSCLNTFLLINGSDHLYQDPDFTAMVREVKEAYPELDIKNGSIADYAEMAKSGASQSDCLRTVEGEMRISGTDRTLRRSLPAGAG